MITFRLNRNLIICLFTAILMFLIQSNAFAHARWVIGSVTPPRTNDTGLKVDPCGGKARTNRSTIFSAGQTIELEFEETVNHPGHYRIAFSPADDLNFDSYVLMDNIPDTTNTGRYTEVITIPPDQICSACTLQLIQVMTTSTNPQPGDFYYSCSDIQITAAGDTTKPAPVSSVSAVNGSTAGQANISWTNPTDDFYRAVILKSTSPILDEPVGGNDYTAGDMINGVEVIYSGNANSTSATALALDTTYYFKVFSQNPRKNYAAGQETSVMITAVNNGGGNPTNPPGSSNTDDSGSGSISPFWIILFTLLLLLRYRSPVSRR